VHDCSTGAALSIKEQCTLTPTDDEAICQCSTAGQCNTGRPFAPKVYTPFSDFYKIWLGERVPGPHPHAKFHRCGFKMWVYSPKIAKINIVWYKLAKRVYPLSDFYKIWHEERVPGPHPHAKLNFHRCGFKNVGLVSPKL